MKSITETMGLGEIRTAVSTHARSASRHKGSGYFDILSLGMEKLRLESEMAWLSKRQRRIENRLAEIRDALDELLEKARQKESFPSPCLSDGAAESQKPEAGLLLSRKWRRMPMGY